MITVAIIEDNRLVREGMRDMLNDLPDVQVVLAATSFETAMLKEANPRVILLDIGLQDSNCLQVAENVQTEIANARVIVMDLLPVHEELAEFVNVGVAGFILKDATFEDFVDTIRSVAVGERVLPPRMTGTLFSQIARAAVKRSETRSDRSRAAHATGTRSGGAHRAGHEQQGDREPAHHRHRHGQEPRSERDGQAGAEQPAADRRVRAPPGRLAGAARACERPPGVASLPHSPKDVRPRSPIQAIGASIGAR